MHHFPLIDDLLTTGFTRYTPARLADDLLHGNSQLHPLPIEQEFIGDVFIADELRFKVPAITIFGMTREGVAPYWHQPADTFDKMDAQVMERTWEFVKGVVGRMEG